MLEIIAKGFIFDKGAYLRDNWNILDFFIVLASILDIFVISENIAALKIFTLLHTLRPLRFISHSDTMKLVVIALL